MNERIKELAEQAESQVSWGDPSNRDDHNRALDEWQEKFAELIVKECVKCCEEIANINNTYKEVDLVDPEFGPKECIETIKKHFGVEE